MNRFSLVLLVLASTGVLVNACSSSSEEAAPSRPPHTTTPAPVAEGGVAEDAAPPDPSCVGDAGCYLCEPQHLTDFLNACTDGECIPFDNAARLPLYKAGEALPPVP